MNPETRIEKAAVDLVYDNLGIKGSKLNILGENGFPDRIFWIPGGRPLLIEFKVPGEEPRKLQEHKIAWLKSLDYDVEVHDNEYDAFQAVIEKVATTRLSKESGEILDRARRRCTLLRSRVGEDVDFPGGD